MVNRQPLPSVLSTQSSCGEVYFLTVTTKPTRNTQGGNTWDSLGH